MPVQHYDNPIIELLVKLEQAKREKERTICVRTARQLLDDPVVVADLLRPLYYGANSAAVDTETLGLTKFERELFCKVATGALTIGQAIASAADEGEAGGLDEYHVDRVHHMLVTVESKITAELRMAEADEYVRASGSILDWREEKPLDEYVVERIESKLSELKEEPYRRLHVFIILTIEGRTAKHEAVRRVLDRLVRVGFADELLREVWERYPIEAAKLELPKSRQEQPSEAAAEDPSPRPVSSPLDRPAVALHTLRPSHVKACEQRKYAQEHVANIEPGQAGDKEAHEWLTDHGDEETRRPVAFLTWARYLREVRKRLGHGRSAPLSRQHGSSIVRPDQV